MKVHVSHKACYLAINNDNAIEMVAIEMMAFPHRGKVLGMLAFTVPLHTDCGFIVDSLRKL